MNHLITALAICFAFGSPTLAISLDNLEAEDFFFPGITVGTGAVLSIAGARPTTSFSMIAPKSMKFGQSGPGIKTIYTEVLQERARNFVRTSVNEQIARGLSGQIRFEIRDPLKSGITSYSRSIGHNTVKTVADEIASVISAEGNTFGNVEYSSIRARYYSPTRVIMKKAGIGLIIGGLAWSILEAPQAFADDFSGSEPAYIPLRDTLPSGIQNGHVYQTEGDEPGIKSGDFE